MTIRNKLIHTDINILHGLELLTKLFRQVKKCFSRLLPLTKFKKHNSTFSKQNKQRDSFILVNELENMPRDLCY